MLWVQLKSLTVKLLVVGTVSLVSYAGAQASCPLSGFAAPPSFPVVQYPSAVASADFNGDGISDAVVASDNANRISLLLGNGAGSFSLAGTFVTGTRPGSVAAGDFNNDSKPDVVTTNYNSGNISIFANNGAGGFGAATNISTGTLNPSVVVSGLLNNDLNQDLAIAHFDGTVSIMLGNGLGGFSAPIGNTKPVDRAVSLALGDFNIDGKADLAVVGQFDNRVWIMMGNGNGGFGPATGYLAGSETTDVAAADFNNDGKPDLVVSIYASKLAIFINNGDGSFAAAVIYSIGGSVTSSVVVTDLNNDGENDLAVGHNTGISVRFGNGAGGFGATTHLSTATGPTYLAADDFNSDGSSDLVVAAYNASSVLILLNNGTGSFATTVAPRYVPGSAPNSVLKADFNNDGKLDLAVANRNSSDISVILGNGSGGFGATTHFSVGPPPTGNVSNGPMSLASGDFNNDGKVDLVTANFTGGSVSILLGDGAGNFPSPTKVAVGSGYPWFVAVGDFNTDGKADLAISRDGLFDIISVLSGDGAGGFGAPVDFGGVFGPRPIAVGDFNGDTKPDLAVGNQFPDDITILLNNGSGGFGPGTHYPVASGTDPKAIVIGDFSGDGKVDLVVANEFADNIALLTGTGTGAFSAPVFFTVGDAPSGLAMGDFNGDGLPDVAVANSTSGSVSVLLGNGLGVFSPAANYDTGFLTSVAAGDFNSDGKLDLATDGIRVLINNCVDTTSAPLPSLSVNDITVSEESGSASFSVALSAASIQPVSVQYYVSGQSAVRTADFQAVSGTLNFMPGETSKPVVVPIVNDSLSEFTESFKVNLHHPVGAIVRKRTGFGNITNSDPDPTVAIHGQRLNEGNSGTTPAQFIAAVSFPSGKAISITYSTANETATAGSDYQAASNQTLSIPAGSSSATISILVNGDTSIEADETFVVNLSNAENATLTNLQAVGTIVNDDSNPIDQPAVFVRQHYLDFFSREPDASGLAFWTDQIAACGLEPSCIAVKRNNVSAAFFVSTEFQETGYLVYRIYKAAYGNIPNAPVPVRFNELVPDTQQIGAGVVVGQTGWEQQLESNKQSFALAFVNRTRFSGAHLTTLMPAQFVDALFTNAGVTPSPADRTAAINEFGAAGNTADMAARSRALRKVAENSLLTQQEYNRAFVLMQYFGYLRRNPNDAPEPGLDFAGYDFWLNKLNQFNGNYINAEMVKAFITSGEYRQRF